MKRLISRLVVATLGCVGFHSFAVAAPESQVTLLNGILRIEGRHKDTDKIKKYVSENETNLNKSKSSAAIIEELRKKVPGDWNAESGKSISIGSSKNLSSIPYISDPLADPVPFALVDIKTGWMVSHSNADLGGSEGGIKDTLEARTNQIKRVTLFAGPQFSGEKLSQWSRKIVAGGITALTQLVQQKEFKGQWGYLYFNYEDEAKCSSTLNCKFKDPRKRLVVVSF